MNATQAVILLGGQGTRLRDLYPDLPKALVPVAGRPFIEWQVDWLRRGGITDIHLAAGYKADQIAAWAASQNRVTVTHEPEPLGTGGALKYVEPQIAGGQFLVLNGDTLLPGLDFQRLENEGSKSSNDWKKSTEIFQRLEKPVSDVSNDWKIAIAVTRIEAAGRFGTVEFDEAGGRITAFREKAEREAGWINGGVYLMDKRALADIPTNRFHSLETDAFPEWVRTNRLIAVPTAPPLLDMGTPDGLAEMAAYLTRG